MDRKLRLLWDFRGLDSLETAKHHAIHLNELVAIEKLTVHQVAILEQNDYVNSAYLIIDEKGLDSYRNALKPHRITIVV